MQNEQIASRIKAICKEKKIAIALMLAECDISKSFIYDTEKRRVSPSCASVTKIADYLDVSVDYLLGRTDNPNINK